MNDKVTIIRSDILSLKSILEEFWEYRELLYILTLRHIKVRYKQTIVGVTWVLIQPLVGMIIFSTIFGKFAKIPSENIPYPIFSYSGLVLWGLFSESINRSSSSLVRETQLIKKVYFPRLIIPFSAVGSAGIDFGISLFLLFPLIYFYGLRPTWTLFLLPIPVFFVIILSSGVGTLLATFNARYRDFQYIIPFVMQIWFYSSPIVYPTEIIPKSLLFVYYLNPMVSLLEFFRYSLTGETPFNLLYLGWSTISSMILLWLGIVSFKSFERDFADYL